MLRLLVPFALLTALLACGETASEPAPAAPAAPTPAEPALPAGLAAVDLPDAPLTTALPTETGAHASRCDEAGCTYVFGLSDGSGAPRPDASVSFFFPATALSLDELRQAHIDGPTGAFATHPDWQRKASAAGNAAQPWLQEAHAFDNEAVVGRIMLGTSPRGNFVVTELIAREALNAARPVLSAAYVHLKLRDAG
jgi:hypothetical protein